MLAEYVVDLLVAVRTLTDKPFDEPLYEIFNFMANFTRDVLVVFLLAALVAGIRPLFEGASEVAVLASAEGRVDYLTDELAALEQRAASAQSSLTAITHNKSILESALKEAQRVLAARRFEAAKKHK